MEIRSDVIISVTLVLTRQSKLDHFVQSIVDGPVELLWNVRCQNQHELVRLLAGPKLIY